jgi:hypothetical protein
MLSFLLVLSFVLALVLGVGFAANDVVLSVVFLASSAALGYIIFKDTMNMVQYVGRFYWVTRDSVNKDDKRISIGFMRQIDYPWLVGKGIQLKLKRHTVQVGWCKKRDIKKEEEGLLSSLGGHYMNTSADELSNWG